MKVIAQLSALAFALVSASPSLAADSDQPLVLEPSSNWNLDYGEEDCRLGRSFGEGEDKVILIFAKYAPGTDMEIMLTGRGLSADRARDFSYRFDPQQEVEVDRPLFGDTPDDGTIWQFSGGLLAAEDFDADDGLETEKQKTKSLEEDIAKKVESFTVQIGRKTPITLRTGKLSGAIAAMDVCLDNLVTSWGYDTADLATIATWPKPKGSITSWFNYRDYPGEALRKDLSGAVRFRLAIDATGSLTDCVIQSSYSDPSFPEKVCSEFLRKAKFEPARNAAGEGVASYWNNTVVFLSQP